MVKIRRAYEVLFLGLFLFFLVITDLRYLKGWPVSLFLEATPLVAVATALTTHTIYRNLVWGLVIIAITMMLGPGLVQLDVPVRHPAPLLRLDRQPAQHQADDRGQPLSQDLRAQVLHPGGDDRDGRPLDHPDGDRRSRPDLARLPRRGTAADRGVAGLRGGRDGHRAARPRSTSGATARFRSACSTRSR